MSRHRRHAANFTDSLNSFQCTNSEIDLNTFCSYSCDSLDNSESNHKADDAACNDKHSTILAGSSNKDFPVQNTFISSVILQPSLQSVPDLNKRINLFQSENLKAQYQHNLNLSNSPMKVGDDKENSNPQCTKKCMRSDNYGISNKLTNELSSQKEKVLRTHNKLQNSTTNGDSKRDTNYNIHSDKSDNTPALEENLLNLTSESPSVSLSDCTNKDKCTYNTNIENKQIGKEVRKFETLLCSLDTELNSIKEVSRPQQLLKRLSDIYVNSPQNFTERLLTIIEESIINNDNDTCNTSAINLSRLTTEFRKMCKFIEDESPPEWPVSLLLTPEQTLDSPTQTKTIHDQSSKTETLFTSPKSTPCLSRTPISAIDLIKRKLFYKGSKNNSATSNNTVLNLSLNESNNASFERLESQCKRLFPEEKQSFQPLRRSLSVPSLLSMSQIQDICDKQMASLNSSTVREEDRKEKMIRSASNLLNKCLCKNTPVNTLDSSSPKVQQELYHKLKAFQCDNVSYSKKKSIRINGQPEFNSVEVNKVTNDYTTFDPDELEKTLLQDLMEKRKRCLDTARLLAEINADPAAIKTGKSFGMSPVSPTNDELNSPSIDEAKFLKTLMSCKDYQTYLEKQKPLFNLLQKSNILCTVRSPVKESPKNVLQQKEDRDSRKRTDNVKKSPNIRNVNSSPNTKFHMFKSPLPKKGYAKNKEEMENVKPKLFVTPGKKFSTNKNTKKRIYFPSLHSPVKNTMEKNMLKSPHAEGLYRLNYNTIVSPVGMYIRGTDMKLIKNVRAKTDGLLLTPVRKDVKLSPNRNLRQATSSKGVTKDPEKKSLKLNLSPKQLTNEAFKEEINVAENYNTPKSHFQLPKVSYKLPLQVTTLKENTPSKPGNRVKKLLESAQSKIVIRHQGRRPSTHKRDHPGTPATNEVFEINYEPEDESIHIEQAASKTNFIHRAKYI